MFLASFRPKGIYYGDRWLDVLISFGFEIAWFFIPEITLGRIDPDNLLIFKDSFECCSICKFDVARSDVVEWCEAELMCC